MGHPPQAFHLFHLGLTRPCDISFSDILTACMRCLQLLPPPPLPLPRQAPHPIPTCSHPWFTQQPFSLLGCPLQTCHLLKTLLPSLPQLLCRWRKKRRNLCLQSWRRLKMRRCKTMNEKPINLDAIQKRISVPQHYICAYFNMENL